MVEAVCFETDHRYVRSIHHEGYVCLKCRAFISLAEFEKRANNACNRRAQRRGAKVGKSKSKVRVGRTRR